MPRPGFDKAAWFYETAANWYSLGQIPASKRAQLEHLRVGDDVLYVGVGTGDDALLAAEHGCRVTCLDLSAGMLDRARVRFSKRGLDARFLEQDVLCHEHHDGYDVVVANYFLNSFVEADMRRVLAHIASLVKPNGNLLIADVAPPHGNLIYWCLNRIHIRTAFYVFWLLGLVPFKPTYDYRPYLAENHLQLVRIEWFRLLGYGPVCYQSICATRCS
jgi:ubiquinone/menaquinone biosynthesis C-methylase UbiE